VWFFVARGRKSDQLRCQNSIGHAKQRFQIVISRPQKFQKHDSFDVNVNAQTNTTVTYQEKFDRIIIFSLTKYQVFNRFDQNPIQEPI
jgi:hypothetical protein